MLPTMRSKEQLLSLNDETYLMAYNDEPLTKRVGKEQLDRLKRRFGKNVPNGFFEELTDSLRRNNFTNQRLIDAVDYAIDNCEFISVKEILLAGKKIKLFTREEFLKETNQYSADYKKYYVAIDVDGKLFYAHKTQIEDCKIQVKLWDKKVVTAVTNVKYPEKETSTKFNIFSDYMNNYKKVYFSEDGEKLKEEINNAQMSWGNDVDEYERSMNEIKKLEHKLKL